MPSYDKQVWNFEYLPRLLKHYRQSKCVIYVGPQGLALHKKDNLADIPNQRHIYFAEVKHCQDIRPRAPWSQLQATK